ncbi:unnamed protein product [Durusdinium trenchii]|uniref:Pentatricopeptide repeat-containing protein, chloroplastic n=1 Tax=Durusdinium trenchii TaxID=1381693 RepID=A0ABP0K914_9DINO
MRVRVTRSQSPTCSQGGESRPRVEEVCRWSPAHATEQLGRWARSGRPDVAQEMLQAMSIARLQVNLIHYNVVLSAFGPVPQWASAVSVLGRLRACGLLPDAFSFTHLCSACNSWPKALGLLSQLPASNTICFNGLIRVVDRDWPLAMEILQVMSHRRLKPESWTASSCAAACKEKWRMALQLLEVDGGDVVVNTVVSPCEQAKSWRRSLQVLLGGAVRRLSASVLRHSAAVAAIDWAMGLQLWEEMRKLLLWPNEITCSSALTACGRSVTWRAAASLLVGAEETTVRPNAICRRMATVAFEQASQWADACVLGSEAASRPVAIVALGSSSRWRHALQFRSASSRGIGPSEEAAALLGGLATAGAWEMALQDAWWKDVSPPALHSILRAIAKARRWPLAFRLLRHLQLLRTRPSGGVAYSIVLDSCDTAGAWNTALHQLDAPVVLAAMPAPVGSCPGAGAAVSACQREAQWRWALRLLPEPAEPADEMSFVSAMNAIPAWTRAIWLLCSSPLARIQPHERLQNSAVASAAAGSAWQLAMHVRPRVGGAAELEVLAACERRDLWTSVTIGVQAVQDVALLGLQGVSDKKVDSVRVTTIPKHQAVRVVPFLNALDLRRQLESGPPDTDVQGADKFALVERVTQLTLASQVNCFEAILGLHKEILGLEAPKWMEVKRWAERAEVSLRFTAEERCSFLREETREVEDASRSVTEFSVGYAMGLTSKTVTKETQFFWNFEVTYKVELLRGVGAEASDRLLLQSHSQSTELKNKTKVSPRPAANVPAHCESVRITELLKLLHDGGLRPIFQIDRSSPKTKTPRRNAQTAAIAEYLENLVRFFMSVTRYLESLSRRDAFTSSANLSAETIFVPALPLFADAEDVDLQEVQESGPLCLCNETDRDGPVISVADGNRLLKEEMRTWLAKKESLAEEVQDRGVFTPGAAFLLVGLLHCLEVVKQWCGSLNFVEQMLQDQLVAAIGKEVTVVDFAHYMRFHYRKLFREAFQPTAFSFPVRRDPRHSPEGTLSIEEKGGVSFTGNVHLHAWLAHEFAGQRSSSLSLLSRAQQFSCFMVLVGRVTSATEFDPKYAILLQNKDELEIPLDLSTIPTPQEFKDAIESLSPEQQAFAKAFRAMQLESTLFGIVVVQIKPQLEQLLNLPVDSLTKEIKLTQELQLFLFGAEILQLFVKFQIPSDLLSFSPDLLQPQEAATPCKRLEVVQAQVKEMTSMIEGEKVQELQVRKAEEELKQAEQLKKQKISEEMRWGDRQSDWRPGVSGGDRGLKMARENWRGENKSESRIIQIRKRFPGQNSMNQANLRRVKDFKGGAIAEQ